MLCLTQYSRYLLHVVPPCATVSLNNPPPISCFAFPRNLDLAFVAQDEGESVFVHGVKDASLRSQLAAFLTALGLADPAGKGDKPQAFRCRGGGVLRGVAALMDDQDLAKAPRLDRQAAFTKAKEVSRLER